jgi:DNA polymerase II large subunit DP2.
MEMDYREELKNNLNKELEIAERVRGKGLDPEVDVEIKIARDLAERVEQLVGPEGVAERIRALWSKDREELSLQIAMEIARGKIGKFKNEEEAMFHAVRCGLAALTEGVLVAPLEGLIKAKRGKNFDGSEYADIFFAGPIRSAGGTAQAMAVLIADVVRRERGLDRYKPVDEEIERCKEEIPLYKRLQHLQYLPSPEEIDLIVRNCPVFIDGEGTEKEEISGLRGLSRFETDRVRGGACLVIAEGMCLKARKLQKHVKKLGIDGWEFIDEFIRVQEEKKEETGGEGEEEGDAKYLRDVVGGRPVISHPGRAGGFRLRYGRARTSGLAACALNPIVFTLLDDFLATGTQIKIETPGKAAAVTACDGLDRPSVLLDNGDFIEVKSIKEAKELRKRISQIIDLGEILIPYGEFLENNKPLLPQGYTREWWEKEYEEKTGKKFEGPVDFVSLLEISRNHSLPLHPDFNLFWNSVSVKGVKELRDHILKHGKIEDERLFITKDEKIKEVLIELGVYHLEKDGGYEIIQHTMPLLFSLGLKIETERISEAKKDMEEISAFRYVSSMLGVEVKNKAPTMIGVRMGRPEKSKERLMRPAPHVLFPLRLTGGKQRLVQEAAKSNYPIEVEIATRKCSSCGRETHRYRCTCGERTDFNGVKKVKIDVKKELENALGSLKENDVVNIKGVEGLISRKRRLSPWKRAC